MVTLSDGDLRKSITTLQSTSKLFRGVITDLNILEVAAIVPDNVVHGIYRELNGNFEGLYRYAEELMCLGYQPDCIVFQLFDFFVARDEISDYKKAKIAEILAEADYGLIAGGNEYLQIVNTLTNIQKVIKAN